MSHLHFFDKHQQFEIKLQARASFAELSITLCSQSKQMHSFVPHSLCKFLQSKLDSQLSRQAIAHKAPALPPPYFLPSVHFPSISTEVRKHVLGKGGTSSLWGGTLTVETLTPLSWVDLVWHRSILQRAGNSGVDSSFGWGKGGFEITAVQVGTGDQHSAMALLIFS